MDLKEVFFYAHQGCIYWIQYKQEYCEILFKCKITEICFNTFSNVIYSCYADSCLSINNVENNWYIFKGTEFIIMKIFCNVFVVTFDHFSASSLNKSINYFLKSQLTPNVWTVEYSGYNIKIY